MSNPKETVRSNFPLDLMNVNENRNALGGFALADVIISRSSFSESRHPTSYDAAGMVTRSNCVSRLKLLAILNDAIEIANDCMLDQSIVNEASSTSDYHGRFDDFLPKL
jgi:hypothetical protein